MIIYENATYKIQRFVSGMLDNNSYLISSAKTNKSIIIDILDNPRDYSLKSQEIVLINIIILRNQSEL